MTVISHCHQFNWPDDAKRQEYPTHHQTFLDWPLLVQLASDATTSDRDRSRIDAVGCDSPIAGSLRDAGSAALGLLDQRPEILLIRLAGRFAGVSIASGTLSASGRLVVCAGINPRRGPASASAIRLSPIGAASAFGLGSHWWCRFCLIGGDNSIILQIDSFVCACFGLCLGFGVGNGIINIKLVTVIRCLDACVIGFGHGDGGCRFSRFTVRGGASTGNGISATGEASTAAGASATAGLAGIKLATGFGKIVLGRKLAALDCARLRYSVCQAIASPR